METTIPTKVITITILASDIRKTNYINTEDCAITRALRRVTGDVSIMHCGTDIEKLFTFKPHEFIPSPIELNERVLAMYYYSDPKWKDAQEIVKEEPSDFTFDLEVPEHWVTTTNN